MRRGQPPKGGVPRRGRADRPPCAQNTIPRSACQHHACLYKHLLESLNVAAESDEGTGLIEQLSESDLASAVDGFDAHMAAAMADFEEEGHSSSEEDLENEPVS